MTEIAQHIYELLFLHDCVIIPDFGGFVANYVPASFDDASSRIYPPKKHLLFNKNLINNDGLLAHRISASDNIQYDKALQMLKSYAQELEKKLLINKRVELSGIGILYIKDNNYHFKSERNNFLMSSFGLPVINALPFDKETTEEPKTAIPVINLQRDYENQKTTNKKYWWVAAALLPIVFYSAWIPLKTNLFTKNGDFHYSDLNPFSFEKNRMYKRNSLVSCDVNDYDVNPRLEVLIVNKNLDQSFGEYQLDDSDVFLKVQLKEENLIMEPISTYVEKEAEATGSEITSEDQKGYFVVGGCFKKNKNAKNFLKKLKSKGYDALEVDLHKGLHRIALGKYSSRKEAKKSRKEILDQDGISTWILKKE